MGLIHIELFATLDLVGQSPGSPNEDPVGFAFGGWRAPLIDDVTGAQVGAAYDGTDALLLGRRTYDIFASYWPYQQGEIATLFNRVPKYVASRGRPDLSWAGSTQLGPDLAGAVREIRDRHEHVKAVGSLNLVQTLLREKLPRPPRPLGTPGRARRRKEGVRRRRGAHERHAPRTAGCRSTGHRVPALRTRRWHPQDWGHERT